MEQKQLDDLEESYSEEFIDEEDFDEKELSGDEEVKIEEVKPSKKVKESKEKAEKSKVSKTNSKKVEKKVKAEKAEKIERQEPRIEILPEEKVEEKTEKIEVKEEVKAESTMSTPPVNPWADDNKEEGGMFKEVSTWKALTGIVIILLVFSIFTQGFHFTDVAASSLTAAQAQEKTLNYVNNFLLEPPYQATVESTKEVNGLYQVALSVDGQVVNSYLSKDGKLFFPQGFEVIETTSTPSTVAGEISLTGEPMLGQANAPVTIVEYTDFQCPFCKNAWSTMKMIEANFVSAGKVKIVFKDFPLDFHEQAFSAALAGQCAEEQGKFWEYHDILFENQAQLSTENYKKWAADLKLDLTKFNDCLSSEKYKVEVEQDLAEGQQLGVSGTPAFFINGKMLTGAQPYATFRDEINAALGVETPVEVPAEEPVEEIPVETAPIVEVPVETAPVETTPVEEPNTAVKEYSLTAKKWLFSPNKITVKQGERVKFTIVPSGLEFTFALPAFNVEEAVSGQTVVEFTADQKGTFTYSCASCEAWRGMTGTLVVE